MRRTRAIVVGFTVACVLGGLVVSHHLGLAQTGTALVVDSIPTPADNLSGLSFDGSSLWATVDESGTIYQADPETGKALRRLSFPSKSTGGSAWDGRFLWQLAYKDRTISKMDIATGATREVIPSPGKGQCSGMTYDGKYLWVANFDEERIYEIDPARHGQIVRFIDGNHEVTGLAWDGKTLWFGIVLPLKNRQEDAPRLGVVEQLNLLNQEITRSYPVAGVGPGTSDWTPQRPRATRFWWYDGYHHRLARIKVV